MKVKKFLPSNLNDILALFNGLIEAKHKVIQITEIAHEYKIKSI